MISDPASARLARLVLYAMDQHLSDPANLTPLADPRLAADGWRLIDYIDGWDRVLIPGNKLMLGGRTCYGYLAQCLAAPTQYAAVIRGTNGTPEWIKDAFFVPYKHPVAGTVEDGFYSVYSSMGLSGRDGSLAASIAAVLPRGSAVKVIGHSLGSADATYLTFDLARLMGGAISGLFFASPRAGSKAFCAAFDALVKAYTLYNFARDIVPDVPFGPDYDTLPRARVMHADEVQAQIKFDFGAFHHIVSYIAELDYATYLATTLNDYDKELALCIRGPSGGLSIGSSP